MSTLEEELRAAVKSGLLMVNLYKDWKGPNWVSGHRHDVSLSIIIEEDPDPVEAFRKALRAGLRDAKKNGRPVPADIPLEKPNLRSKTWIKRTPDQEPAKRDNDDIL